MKFLLNGAMLTVLLVGSQARLNDNDNDERNAERKLAKAKLSFGYDINQSHCKGDMVKVNFSFRTDKYPDESTVQLFNKHDEIVWEWGPFKNAEAKYTYGDEICEGRYELVILDSANDGLGHDYGEFRIERDSDNKKLVDKTLQDFGHEYTTDFWVDAEQGGSNPPSNGGGNGPLGCPSAKTTKNCRCCKDECQYIFKNKSDIKDCKTNECRSHYGRQTCKD